MIIHPGDFLRSPGGNLVEMEEAQSVQGLLILGANAADALEIVGLAAPRRRYSLRPRGFAGGRRRFCDGRGLAFRPFRLTGERNRLFRRHRRSRFWLRRFDFTIGRGFNCRGCGWLFRLRIGWS